MFTYLRFPFFLYYFSCFFLPADGSRQDKKITLAKKNCHPQAESLLYRFTYCKHNPFCTIKRIVLKWLVLYNLTSCFSIFLLLFFTVLLYQSIALHICKRFFCIAKHIVLNIFFLYNLTNCFLFFCGHITGSRQ